jgi:2-dehydropantoate 2-reductase
MNAFPGRIGVVGAGALGGYYGSLLARAGFDVHFLMRRDYDAVKRDGLKVQSIRGDFHVVPPVHRTAAELGPCDVVIIGLKATDNDALGELLAPVVSPATVVLTLQNGLGNEERIASVLEQRGIGRGNIVGGVAFLCSNRIAPGVINHTDHGWIRIAEFEGQERERTSAVKSIFDRAGIDCQIGESVPRIRWEKLLWNIPFNGLGVAAGRADSAVIMADPELLGTARALMHEVVAAARADAVELDAGEVERMIDRTRSMGAYKSSMQLDFEAGRALEVEAIIGEPVRRARAAGISVPHMEMLYALVRRLDAHNRG